MIACGAAILLYLRILKSTWSFAESYGVMQIRQKWEVVEGSNKAVESSLA